MSDTQKAKPKTRAVSIRVSEQRLRQIKRVRRIATTSELINTLLVEEEERLQSHAILKETSGTARPADFDDRLL